MKIVKKTAVRAIFIYLLLTVGLYMFLESYTGFQTRLSGGELTPASIVVSEDTADITVLEHSVKFNISVIKPESKFYLVAYLLVPDELKADILIATFVEKFGLSK